MQITLRVPPRMFLCAFPCVSHSRLPLFLRKYISPCKRRREDAQPGSAPRAWTRMPSCARSEPGAPTASSPPPAAAGPAGRGGPGRGWRAGAERPRPTSAIGPAAAPPRPAPPPAARQLFRAGGAGAAPAAVAAWAGADSARPAHAERLPAGRGKVVDWPLGKLSVRRWRRGAVRCGRVSWRRVAPLRSQRGALRRRGGHARRQPAAALR